MNFPRFIVRLALVACATFVFGCASTSQAAGAGKSLAVNRVKCLPAGAGQTVIGGTFSGSNISRTEGFEELAVIKTAPSNGQAAEITFENKKVYRWLRYVGPPGSREKPAQVEFHDGTSRVAGEGKNSLNDPFPLVDAPDRQSVTFDLADAVTARRPSFEPGIAQQDSPVDVKIVSSPGATIRYTLDGSWPTADHGEIYKDPIHLEKTSTLEATAIQEGRAPSVPNAMTYLIRGSNQPGFSSAHIGNSLTGTTSQFFRYARTAGHDHQSVAFLRGGALTRELWDLASGDFASDPKTRQKEETARKRGSVLWDDFWKKVGKVDIVTVQPRDFDMDKEVLAEINFFNLFRQKSPDLQPWLYCEWVEMKRQRPSDLGQVPSSQMKKTFPALTWEESMGAMLLYVEELQKMLGEKYRGGKRPRVLPAALAMGWIKNMIDHGQLPGVKPGNFYPLLFSDQVHPKSTPSQGGANGGFLVDMTWYSAFYREPSEGHVLPIETTFTPEQALKIQRLAWDVIKNYPDCGLYVEGKEPCGAPEFAMEKTEGDVKKVNLHSTTPGAWFRYTLDGTPPTRTNGYVYCGVVSFRAGMELKAIAYKSGMADSTVTSMNLSETK